jgi:chromatin structure-remodeling complex subunit RSC1/2
MIQRMVNKRLLPDYFDVIKEPVAFSTIRVCSSC